MRPARLMPIAALALLAGALAWWLAAEGDAPAPPAPLEADDPQGTGRDDPGTLRADGPDGDRPGSALGTAGNGRAVTGVIAAEAPLTGRVVDEDGRGIHPAQVDLYEVDPQSLRGAPFDDLATLSQTGTDVEGRFELEATAGRWLRVVASAPGRATVGLLVASAGAEVVLVLPPAGALQVQVLDAAGSPREQVPVEAIAGDARLTRRSDAQGTARFETLPPGPVRVRAGGEAWPTIVAGPFAVRAGASTQALVVLPRSVPVAGVLVDAATDRPVADAVVHVAHPGRSTMAPPSDAQGRFGPVAGGGAGERVYLAVDVEGYAPLREPLVLRALDVQTVTLRLQPADAWRGLVQFADGRPAAGAEVGYTPDGIEGLAPAVTTSDEQGRFALPPPPPPAPGRRVVLTARLGTALGALALRPDTPRPAALRLTLQEGSTVSGRVSAPEGMSPAGVVVRLVPAWDDVPRTPAPDEAASRLLAANELGFQGLATASGADGRWQVRGVPAGPYRVIFEHEGGRQERDEALQVAAGPVDAGVQRLGGGLVLEGRVGDADGTPLAGVDVRVAPEGGPTRARSTTTDVRGEFSVAGLEAGTHRVRATWPGRDPLDGLVDLDPGRGARIDLAFERGGTLRGRVTQEGRPFRGVLTIALHGADGRESPRSTRHLRIADGRFELDDLPSGTWTLEAFGTQGLRGRATSVDIAPGRGTETLVGLVAAARVHGVVRAGDGAPVAGARVMLQVRETGRRVLATSGMRGEWSFDGLLPGGHTLSASGRGGAPVEDAVDLLAGEDRERDLTLLPAGALEIVVRDGRGRTVSGAVLTFRSDAGVLRTRRPLRTDAQGRARREGLPPGTIEVRARAPDGRVGTARAVVSVDGKAAEVEVRVGP